MVSVRAERVEWALFRSAQQLGSQEEALIGSIWCREGAQPQVLGFPELEKQLPPTPPPHPQSTSSATAYSTGSLGCHACS